MSGIKHSHCRKGHLLTPENSYVRPDSGTRRCRICMTAYQAKHRPTRQKAAMTRLRNEAFEAYGGRCVCCGIEEITVLQLDHIHDDGSAHRQAIGWGTGKGVGGQSSASGSTTYRWLRQRGWPAGIVQILCANCHVSKTKGVPCTWHEGGHSEGSFEGGIALNEPLIEGDGRF